MNQLKTMLRLVESTYKGGFTYAFDLDGQRVYTHGDTSFSRAADMLQQRPNAKLTILVRDKFGVFKPEPPIEHQTVNGLLTQAQQLDLTVPAAWDRLHEILIEIDTIRLAVKRVLEDPKFKAEYEKIREVFDGRN